MACSATAPGALLESPSDHRLDPLEKSEADSEKPFRGCPGDQGKGRLRTKTVQGHRPVIHLAVDVRQGPARHHREQRAALVAPPARSTGAKRRTPARGHLAPATAAAPPLPKRRSGRHPWPGSIPAVDSIIASRPRRRSRPDGYKPRSRYGSTTPWTRLSGYYKRWTKTPSPRPRRRRCRRLQRQHHPVGAVVVAGTGRPIRRRPIGSESHQPEQSDGRQPAGADGRRPGLQPPDRVVVVHLACRRRPVALDDRRLAVVHRRREPRGTLLVRRPRQDHVPPIDRSSAKDLSRPTNGDGRSASAGTDVSM